MNRPNRRIRRTAIVLPVLLLFSLIAAATTRRAEGWTPRGATLVLVDRFDDVPTLAREQSPRAVIVRRPNERPLVLVSSATQPDDLDNAVGHLIRSLRSRPYIVEEMRAYISAATPGLGGTDRVRATRDLDRVRNAPLYPVPGLGPRKAVPIRMKPHRIAPQTAAAPRRRPPTH